MATTLNPSDKAANVTLSGGDLTMLNAAPGTVGCVRSVASASSNKFYCEMTVVAGTATYNNGLGIANSTASLTAGSGSPDTNSVALYQGDSTIYAAGGSTGVTGGSYGIGDVVGMAVDMGNSRIWYRVNGGNWNNSGTNDPTTNTGGADISAVSKPWFAIGVMGGFNADSSTFNFGDSAYANAAPSGFGQWGAAAGITLAAGAGSYAITGTAASLKIARKVVAAAGSYAITGTAATLTTSNTKTLAAGGGSYLLSGTPATLLHAYKLAAGAGSYAFTGTAATLSRGQILSAAGGSYAITGTAATPLWKRILSAGNGIYLLSGSAATLTYSAALPDVPVSVGGSISGGTFSRGKWRKLKDEWEAAARAQEELERKALEVTGKRRQVLQAAAKAAEAAIIAASEADEFELQKEAIRLTALIESAIGAKGLSETVTAANATRAYAENLANEIDDDNEEEAILLLLM